MLLEEEELLPQPILTASGIAVDDDGDGVALRARAGYLPLDGNTYRVLTITLPLIVDDVWDEAP